MKEKQGLGTLEGVFTPTLLTILGVIMYLRLGWIVGNAGFVGTLAIIGVAHIITFSTILSMSSMLTNIKIKAGGAYAIITRSFGLEAGGAVGIPLYFSQAFAVSFYIVGFTELWTTFFPHHPVPLVGFLTWLALTLLSIASARLSFRLQYLVLLVVALSIFSFLGGESLNPGEPLWMGSFLEENFWGTFAIFFPAVTGVLAGANMSGELKDPGRSIIKGTLAAVTVGLAVYILLAFWFARQAPEEMLLTNTMAILDLAFYSPLVAAGILGATLSSALSTLVGAPRILAALAENRVIPLASFLARKSARGEPRRAVAISSFLSLAVLLLGTLDSIAQLLTLFFLTTYGVINLVVLVEQTIGIISFRPRFSLSLVVPIVGVIGCVSAMFLINKYFTLVTFLVIIGIYYMLSRKHLVSPWGDVRGGVFIALAEWAAQKAMTMDYHPRLWKPSVLVPVESPQDFRRVSRFIRDLIYSSGRLYYLTIKEEGEEGEGEMEEIEEVMACLKDQGLFAQQIVVEKGRFEVELKIVLQSLLNTFLPPNMLFFTISSDPEKQRRFKKVIESIRTYQVGLMLLYLHPKQGFGQEKRINLWLREKSPNYNLATLSALQLSRNWNASLCLMRAVEDSSQVKKAEESLQRFKEAARLPLNTEIKVLVGEFYQAIKEEPSDLTIIGMSPRYKQLITIINETNHTLVFVADSGLESVLV